MAETIETTKISELATSTVFSGAYVSGVDSDGNTKKFPISSLGDLANKVDKETGKGLSSNDFTSEEKAKLAGIATGANVNVNADWNAASGDARILNKPNLSVYPTRTEVQEMIAAGGGGGMEYVVADSLPTASASTMNKIYLIPITGSDARSQWMTVENNGTYSWVQIGTTEVNVEGMIVAGDVVESNVVINS